MPFLPSSLPLILLTSLIGLSLKAEISLTQYVNPFIGTGSMDENSLSGNNFPGATVPFGLVQLSPDTRSAPGSHTSGYFYDDDVIYGFSHTHISGAGVPDLYDILVLPIIGGPAEPQNASESGYRSHFSHDQESASPGYYQVNLTDYQINAELTATEHVGVHRYTFPQSKDAHILFDLKHAFKSRDFYASNIAAQIKIIDHKTIEGYRITTGWGVGFRKVYFRAEFSKPFSGSSLLNATQRLENQPVLNGSTVRALLHFDTEPNEAIIVKVGLSSTSPENARLNLATEAPGWDFLEIKNAASALWEKELESIIIDGTDAQKEIFYTALYHTFIQPNNLADVSGDYQGTDMVVRNIGDQKHYSTFSLWDTYRATHPLYTLVQPERTAGFINSMLRQYQSHGYLPVWQLWGLENDCMIGNHAISVIVDAALKGIPGFDLESAYQAVRGSALTDHYSEVPYHGSAPITVLEKWGYVPEDIMHQSVSLTLELSFEDWCAAQFAQKLGKSEDYNHFLKRSAFYENLFDPQSKFFRAKYQNGDWISPFNPLTYGANGDRPYTEGNAWQYLFYVPQNIPNLIQLMGGKEDFTAKLDTFFTLHDASEEKNENSSGFIGQYAHGNEPSHHAAYLYDFVGQPWKTQEIVSHVLQNLYKNNPAGYAGNEDCGQMSAWYIFSAMGFYPVNPASGVYAIGSPSLENAVIRLANDKSFTISTHNVSPQNIYIQSVNLNGKPYDHTYITHNDIAMGGSLEFFMGSTPNKAWGARPEDAPPPSGYNHSVEPSSIIP